MLIAGLSGGDLVGVLSLCVTAVGFAGTVFQLHRTATASEATRIAVERTEKRMALNHLLVLLPQFRLLESDLDAAAETDDRKLAMRALVNWAHVASEVAVLLRDQDGVDAGIADRLEQSAREASLAKAELINQPSRPTKSVTKNFRTELTQTTTAIAGLVSRFRITGSGLVPS